MSINLDKSSLRARLKSALIVLKGSGDFESKNKLLASNIGRLFNFHLKITHLNQYKIGAYAPMDLEPSWISFLETEFGQKVTWSYPLLNSAGKMDFCISKYQELEKRRDFGVELLLPKLTMKSCSPDLLFIPGLGFTASGERIGKGKGFYDKYLNGFEGVSVGLCFEEQILMELPTEEHDKKMQFIVTDKRIIKCQ